MPYQRIDFVKPGKRSVKPRKEWTAEVQRAILKLSNVYLAHRGRKHENIIGSRFGGGALLSPTGGCYEED